MDTNLYLCELDELREKQCLGFEHGDRTIFAVYQDETIRVFENRCPHLGTPLEFMPHQFLTHDKQWIICSTHGALFDKDSGQCISGPCSGQRLSPVAFEIRSEALYLRATTEA